MFFWANFIATLSTRNGHPKRWWLCAGILSKTPRIIQVFGIIGKFAQIILPRSQMTSIFEGQPPKARPFPIKTRVICVLGSHDFRISWCQTNPDDSGNSLGFSEPICWKGDSLWRLSHGRRVTNHGNLRFPTPISQALLRDYQPPWSLNNPLL